MTPEQAIEIFNDSVVIIGDILYGVLPLVFGIIGILIGLGFGVYLVRKYIDRGLGIEEVENLRSEILDGFDEFDWEEARTRAMETDLKVTRNKELAR